MDFVYSVWHVLLQVLQQNIDSTYDQLEQERASSSQAQKDVDSLVSQLAEAKSQAAQIEEDRGKLQHQLESLQEEAKVGQIVKLSTLYYLV